MYKNREKLLAAHLKYNQAHREERRILARKWRAKNKEKKKLYDKEYLKNNKGKLFTSPEKYRARKKLRYAVKVGKIIKKPCEVCGDVVSQGHHNDYKNPLEVTWLCREHHWKRHRL